LFSQSNAGFKIDTFADEIGERFFRSRIRIAAYGAPGVALANLDGTISVHPTEVG
jgi:hypothetical protein